MTGLSAPFPYYGGKSRWADQIWRRFGVADVYAEPFAGSLAVLLANRNLPKREVVCDTDGHVCNFWRALRDDPEAVARYADHPTIHQDLTARHIWLRAWADEHSARLSADPDFYDAKAAGWWVWGISIWIGGGWCSSTSERRPLVRSSSSGAGGQTGNGVSAQRAKMPIVSAKPGGRGVNAQRDQIPKVKSKFGGDGVSYQREQMPRVPSDPRGGPGCSAQAHRAADMLAWFEALAERLKRVIVLNRDWASAVTSSVLADTASGPGARLTRCVLLDPPYPTEKRSNTLYQSDFRGESDDAAVQAFQWAVENGDRYRIAYCCHVGDFEVPPGWETEERAFKGTRVARNKSADCIMFSPACVPVGDRQAGTLL